ncbi:hypothetical protein J6590_079857 [Homalodisca vitripennis]|nr:hypothetical protein J6590_079857 [Homalodisca vitripennis]
MDWCRMFKLSSLHGGVNIKQALCSLQNEFTSSTCSRHVWRLTRCGMHAHSRMRSTVKWSGGPTSVGARGPITTFKPPVR